MSWPFCRACYGFKHDKIKHKNLLCAENYNELNAKYYVTKYVSMPCVDSLNWQNRFRAKVRGRWPVISFLIHTLVSFAMNLVCNATRNIELCTGWKGTETWQARWASGIWQKRRMSLFSYLLIKLNVSTWQLDQHSYCQKLHTHEKDE